MPVGTRSGAAGKDPDKDSTNPLFTTLLAPITSTTDAGSTAHVSTGHAASDLGSANPSMLTAQGTGAAHVEMTNDGDIRAKQPPRHLTNRRERVCRELR